MLMSVQPCVPVPLPAEPDARSWAAGFPSGARGAEAASPGEGPSVTQKPAARMFSSVAGPDPAHVDDVLECGKRAVCPYVVQDRTRLRRPDPVDGEEEIRACRVDIGAVVRPRSPASGT